MSREQQPEERSSFHHKTIFIGFGLSLALGFVAAIFIYDRFVTYTPSAVRRVPADAVFVARLNTEQAVVYAPLKSSVLPLFEKGRKGPESRLKHLERKTTIELNVDVRELVFARLAGGEWLLVAAGLLRPDEVLAGVSRMLGEENIPHEVNGDVLVHPKGTVFGVAPDGTLLLGSSREVVVDAFELAAVEPSWAGPLQGRGVALAVFSGADDDTREKIGSASAVGTVAVQADSHFPIRGTLSGWTTEQGQPLSTLKGRNFGGLVPFGTLKFQADETSPGSVRGSMSREQFNDAVASFAALLNSAVFPTP